MTKGDTRERDYSKITDVWHTKFVNFFGNSVSFLQKMAKNVNFREIDYQNTVHADGNKMT